MFYFGRCGVVWGGVAWGGVKEVTMQVVVCYLRRTVAVMGGVVG